MRTCAVNSFANALALIIATGPSNWSHALQMWSKTTLKSLAVPGGVLLAAVALLAYSGWLTLALPALASSTIAH